MDTEFSVFSANSAKESKCVFCNISCSRKNDWDRHVLTRKHIGNTTSNQITAKTIFACNICSKEYKSRKGLWSHKKTCTVATELLISTDTSETVEEPPEKDKVIELLIKENADFKHIVLDMVKSNTELQKQILDVCKNNSINTINSHNNNNNNNNNNKTFNLQFFLNEQCKDAMNITEFADSFDLQLSDLESVGELGYVEGVTKLFLDKLNSMDIYKRPIHCSDAKREIIYVKDANIWTKEEKNNPKLRQAIKNVSFRNMKLVYNWSNMYPESLDHQSRLNDTYMKLVKQSTGGNGPILESENKIIRRIVKEIVIGKNFLHL